jgi:hypothetical protein
MASTSWVKVRKRIPKEVTGGLSKDGQMFGDGSEAACDVENVFSDRSEA